MPFLSLLVRSDRSNYKTINLIYNKILDRDWFCVPVCHVNVGYNYQFMDSYYRGGATYTFCNQLCY